MNAPTRNGDWMQTYSGRQFWPIDPRPDEIFIGDIAAALSNACRFGGHCTQFYSVAEHCVHVASWAEPEHKLTALLHDASEAYLVDIPRPVKKFLSNYTEIEDRLMQAVAERFAIKWPLPAEVKRLDEAVLFDEMEQIMAPPPAEWHLAVETGAGTEIQCWSPEKARQKFMWAYRTYVGE